MMKFLAILLGLAFFGLIAAQTSQSSYEKLRQEADRLYDEKSYGLAYDVYVKAADMNPPAGEGRWIKFRVADTLWRSQSATPTADFTQNYHDKEPPEGLI